MKKIIILFWTIGLFVILMCGCNMTQKEESNKEDKELIEWRNAYTIFLEDLSKSNPNQTYECVIQDLDCDCIPELIIKEQLKLMVYRFDEKIEEVGNYDFSTGTTRFFSSENKSYPGIFCFYVSAGLNHYGYINIQDDELNVQELWNEDYSGISKEMGIDREVIEKISDDDKLIEESRVLYNNNSDLGFTDISNINLDEL